MIGQITPIAMEDVKWRYYFLFVVCNFTNALFFYCLLPETAKVPLESMDNLFENAPWFVPSMTRQNYLLDLEHRKEEIEVKQATAHAERI